MTDNKSHDHKIKIIDVEKMDEEDDNAGGPVDTVDIFDDVTEGVSPRGHNVRRKYLDDIENPLINEEKDVLSENMYQSEADEDEEE